jgi:hypothetical protein
MRTEPSPIKSLRKRNPSFLKRYRKAEYIEAYDCTTYLLWPKNHSVMQGGIIGIIDGTFDELESFHRTEESDGTSLAKSLQIDRETTTDRGHTVYIGEAAAEVQSEEETVRIDSDTGSIEVGEYPTTQNQYTHFVCVPGEFVAVESSSGVFAFNLIQSQHPGTHIERAEIDVNAYAEDYYTSEEVDPWQIGFYGNIGQAEKGVVYGQNVISDEEIGGVLERSQLNQLGLRYEVLGYDMQITMTESGYVQVFNPSNLDSEGFAEYIVEEVLEYQ